MRERTDADDFAQSAYNRAVLDLILPPMRRAAKEAGYALAVHGSLARDIDLIAVPWTEGQVWTIDALVTALCGAVRGVTGRCSDIGKPEQKPHGRIAQSLLVWCGESTAHLDLSVLPATHAVEEKP